MLNVMIFQQQGNELSRFSEYLQMLGQEVIRTSSEQEAIELMQREDVDGMVAMEEDFQSIKRLIMAFPEINVALCSSRTAGEFHEATEGYGIFMQLPSLTQFRDGQALCENLQAIKYLQQQKVAI